MSRMKRPGELPPRIVVAGPTASGKTTLAIALAKALGAHIVSTDSVQVYRRCDIGSAKPSAAERECVPHHLIDVAEPGERYSAARYEQEANAALRKLDTSGRSAVLCGGCGLYFRVLLQGLTPLPSIPPSVRQAVQEELQRLQPQDAHALLRTHDPIAAARIAPADTQRIARGVEIFRASGRAWSDFLREAPTPPLRGPLLVIGLAWTREALYERIGERVQAMLQAGWETETRALLDEGLSPESPPLQAIGYRELVALCLGRRTREHLAEEITRHTRRLAKRQCTWFRHQGFGEPERPQREPTRTHANAPWTLWLPGAWDDSVLAHLIHQVQGFLAQPYTWKPQLR